MVACPLPQSGVGAMESIQAISLSYKKISEKFIGIHRRMDNEEKEIEKYEEEERRNEERTQKKVPRCRCFIFVLAPQHHH